MGLIGRPMGVRSWRMAVTVASALGACAHGRVAEPPEAEADTTTTAPGLEEGGRRHRLEPEGGWSTESSSLIRKVLLTPANPREARQFRTLARRRTRICEEAERDARADIDAGRLLYISSGHPDTCVLRWKEATWEELGVRVVLDGGVYTFDDLTHESCYNHVVEAHVDRDHGEGAIHRIAERLCRSDL